MPPSLARPPPLRLAPPRRLRPLRGPAGRARPLRWLPRFRVLRLVELDLDAAGHREVRHEAVAVVGDISFELHSARAQVGDRSLDVVAVEGNLVRPRGRRIRFIDRMAAEVSLRQVEAEPPFADVGMRKPQLVADELARGL